MKEYTIHEVSKLLGLPKATLRYYDQLGIVSPKRADNEYRFYSEQDITDLKYVELMKFSDLSLMEIRQVLQIKKEQNPDNFPALMEIIEGKRGEIEQKIELYQCTLRFVDMVTETMRQKEGPEDMARVDDLVSSIFENLRRFRGEK